MIFNTIMETLEQAYPITAASLPEETWRGMVHDFFSLHACKSPILWKMPYEFYRFARENRYAQNTGLACLDDLLRFEWLEIQVYMREDAGIPPYRKIKDLRNEQLALNREYVIARLNYPVHLMSPELASGQKGTYYLLIFRRPGNSKLEFVSLSKFLAFLLKQIDRKGHTLHEVMSEFESLFDSRQAWQSYYTETEKFLLELAKKKFILGTKK